MEVPLDDVATTSSPEAAKLSPPGESSAAFTVRRIDGHRDPRAVIGIGSEADYRHPVAARSVQVDFIREAIAVNGQTCRRKTIGRGWRVVVHLGQAVGLRREVYPLAGVDKKCRVIRNRRRIDKHPLKGLCCSGPCCIDGRIQRHRTTGLVADEGHRTGKSEDLPAIGSDDRAVCTRRRILYDVRIARLSIVRRENGTRHIDGVVPRRSGVVHDQCRSAHRVVVVVLRVVTIDRDIPVHRDIDVRRRRSGGKAQIGGCPEFCVNGVFI